MALGGTLGSIKDGVLDTVLPVVPKQSQIVSVLENPIHKYLYGKEKTVTPIWKFKVAFENVGTAVEKGLFADIEYHHILDVTIPLYKFTGNTVPYGSVPKTYATLNSDTGLQFSITFEEDSKGNISKLVHMLQRRTMRPTGVYNTLNNQNLGKCWIGVYNGQSQRIMRWTMNNIWFAGADDISLAYSSSESMKWKINFGCDIVSYEHVADDISLADTSIAKLNF